MIAVKNQVHYIGGVPLIMKVKECFTDAFFLETLKITNVEAVHLGFFMCNILHDLKLAPKVVLC